MIDPRALQFDGDEELAGFGEPAQHTRRPRHDWLRAAAWLSVGVGLAVLIAAWSGQFGLQGTWLGLLGSFGLLVAGTILLFVARYAGTPAGIQNDGLMFSSLTYRGLAGWIAGVGLTGFYLALYFEPEMAGILGGDPLGGLYRTVDPLARTLAGAPADRWFLYGTLYTLSVLVFGVRMLYRYRHSRYHLIRTGSVMFFQLGFAFLIPQILRALEHPEFYPSYFWPLQPKYLFPNDVHNLVQHPGGLGAFMVFWGAVMSFVATPVLTYFYGKRWYCSWVCGCGGLAETMGDGFRHLSDKGTRAWKLERGMVHSVLVVVVLLTIALWVWPSGFSQTFRKVYGFIILSMFAGVIGVGFYPLLGSRVWCRFGCPLAAILGLLQRYFSRFRITTNGGQCMSCGNCSTYCEMGIDVRAYAQQGKNIIRASCVGCGVCSSVCPRGVLKLENGATHKDRYAGADTPVDQFLTDLQQPPHASRPR